MTEHRYTLEPYKGMNTRYDCPGCGKRKTFSRYLDTQTGEHLHPSVGRCNRVDNCGYHYTPKQYFQEHPQHPGTGNGKPVKFTPKPQPNPISFIPFEIFRKSRTAYVHNHFTNFLLRIFDADTACNLISRYHIGTSKHWQTVFWQIDRQGKVRTGKIMLYNPDTGKRVKEKINWVHSVLKIENFNLQQCFFGEHLLNGNTKPVAIVESEKTAVIASVYLPEFIWLAVGGISNLTAERCKVLQGRNVTLYPDLNGFTKWSAKAKELSRLFPGTRFNVSDLLERKATEVERQQGLDLADYLIRFDYKAFQQPEHQQQTNEQPQTKKIVQVQELQQADEKKQRENNGITTREPEIPKPENWTAEITELEQYFKTATLPTIPVMLNQCSTITDISKFIDNTLSVVKFNNGKRTFLPYLERLQQLKTILTVNTN